MGERITVDGRRYLIMFQTGCALFPTHRAENNTMEKKLYQQAFPGRNQISIVGETGAIADWCAIVGNDVTFVGLVVGLGEIRWVIW